MPSTRIEYYSYAELPQREKECEEIKLLYHENFLRLLNSVGKPEQDKYLKLEIELNDKELKIRNNFPPHHKYKLPIDPCPVEASSDCDECSLYFTKRDVVKSGQTTFRMCKKEEQGARLCLYAPPKILEREMICLKRLGQLLPD